MDREEGKPWEKGMEGKAGEVTLMKGVGKKNAKAMILCIFCSVDEH